MRKGSSNVSYTTMHLCSRRITEIILTTRLCHAVKNVRATTAGKASAFSRWLYVVQVIVVVYRGAATITGETFVFSGKVES